MARLAVRLRTIAALEIASATLVSLRAIGTCPPPAEVGLAIGYRHVSGDRLQGTPCRGVPPVAPATPSVRAHHDHRGARKQPSTIRVVHACNEFGRPGSGPGFRYGPMRD